MTTLTVRIDDELDRTLTELARQQGRSKSDLVRRMLKRQTTLSLFEETRKNALPLGERAGYLTDEDVFRDIS
jgi:predicted transcriptional regulator